jgi:hypothetical protein
MEVTMRKKTKANESLRERNDRAMKLSMKYGGLGFVGCRAEADVLGFVPVIGGTGDKELNEAQWKLFANAFNLRCKLHQHTNDSGNPEYKPFDFSAYSADEIKLAVQQLARECSNSRLDNKRAAQTSEASCSELNKLRGQLRKAQDDCQSLTLDRNALLNSLRVATALIKHFPGY